MGYVNVEKRWVFPLVITSLVCVFLLATSFNMGLVSSLRTINGIFSIIPSRLVKNQTRLDFAESKVARQTRVLPHEDKLPRFAYLVSGSKGDVEKLWRTLRAVYHPRNQYVVHLDLESPVNERLELASRINNDPMYSKTGNVYMITKANLVTYKGPTMVANTLHACAVLLKRNANWDWFINLSASDYPLVTQDGIKSFDLTFLLVLHQDISSVLSLINLLSIISVCLKICFIRFQHWTGTSTLSNTQVNWDGKRRSEHSH